MDEKISLDAIALYADAYSGKLLKNFFQKKDKIAGTEILGFSNVQQVNLLIINELFKSWKNETQKVRSPYFDYDNEDVKEALDNLMNVLSRNISVSERDFTPLARRAVSHALLIIFDPYDFYSMLITGNNDQLDFHSLREEIKYLKVNKAPLEKLLEKMEQRNLERISGNEGLALLDEVLEEVSFTPEDVEEYIEKFSIVSPLNPNRFFISETPTAPAKPEPKPVAPPVSTPPVTANAPTPLVTQENRPKEPRATVAGNFNKNRKIKESLTINQKFMFTKVLFHGDFELFTRAVDRLDQLDNLPSALRYIEDEHASTWDRESEEFHEFMELVEQRFS